VRLSRRQAQAEALAASGVEMARLFLAWDEPSQFEAGGRYDNFDRFSNVLVIDDVQARDRGRFTLLAPAIADGYYGGVRYGLEDESTRLNLNALLMLDDYAKNATGTENGGREILMGLPGMTEDIADSILDWIDSDDEPREFGAEIDYYASLDPPYAPKNGPLDTVEELLLIRDVSPWLLFGGDANRNGQVDASEPDASEYTGVDDSDGSMSRGWAAYLTLHSIESNLQLDGQPKIYVNQGDLEALYDELVEILDEQWATFIVALRRYGPSESGEPMPGEPDRAETDYSVDDLDLSQSGDYKLTTILDLIGARVEIKEEEEGDASGQSGGESSGESSGASGGRGGETAKAETSGKEGEQDNAEEEEEPKILQSPFSDTAGEFVNYLPILMEYLTATESERLPARININQAPRTILAGIPGMTDEIVEQVVSQRQPDPAYAETYQQQETWILCDGIVTREQMKALMPFVTAGGNVFRAQVVGYFDEGGPAARIEVILDATTSPAQVVFWRDLTHLGRGYSSETLGVEAPDW
ncbi:MAG: general secretion pathway protein GspK, partial [Planctomycetes bacterium]|nr:general secretion pathway protein GspK [Planctomycetota bacterium]